MNRAVGIGYVEEYPIQNMPKPSSKVRREFLSADTWQRVLDLATDQEFRDYLTLILATGALPQELLIIEAQHFDGEKIVLPIDKSKGRKRSRTIYLPPDAMEIVQRLAEENPEGPLLRNSKGEPWNRNSIRCRFRRLKEMLNMPELCVTTPRHS